MDVSYERISMKSFIFASARCPVGTIFLFSLKIYLFIHERHREKGRDIGRGRSRLPAGSDPKTAGSHPELKADAQPLSPPGHP